MSFPLPSTESDLLQTSPNTRDALMLSARTLSGDAVYNKNGESIGGIKDLMVNTLNGSICYAILSVGGFLGMGEKFFAVPWRALSLDTKNKRLILDITVGRFNDAPGFDRDHWPDMGDAEWQKQIHSYWGVQAKSGNSNVSPA